MGKRGIELEIILALRVLTTYWKEKEKFKRINDFSTLFSKETYVVYTYSTSANMCDMCDVCICNRIFY